MVNAKLAPTPWFRYIRGVVGVKTENGELHVTMPTEGMTPAEVNEFVGWLRVEMIARKSKLTRESAWKLSEDIKSSWWQSNQARFGNQEPG